jgi:transposase
VHTLAEPYAAARLQAVLDLIERHKVKWVLPADVAAQRIFCVLQV